MANITVSPMPDSTDPVQGGHPFVYVKKNWTDEWDIQPDIYVMNGSAVVAGRGLGRMELKHTYGYKKEPYYSSWATDFMDMYLGYWVKIVYMGPLNQGTLMWVGRIPAETRQELGDDSGAKTGFQHYTAYEPLRELDQKTVNGAYIVDLQELKFIGWCPGFNRRDEHNMLIGNRTEKWNGGSYHFGGEYTWTRYDMLEYILNHFADESGSDGPSWQISGQIEILKKMSDVIDIQDGSSVTDVLGQLIPKKYGYDFDIMPRYDSNNDDIEGFTIQIFSKAREKLHFGGMDLPQGPDFLRIKMNSKDVLDRNIEQTTEKKYNSIRVSGERIIICCTLLGQLDEEGSTRSNYQLEGKWTAAMQNEYNSPGGADAKEDDKIRESSKYANVYQVFGALTTWGFAGPVLDTEGNVTGTGASYQTTIRETLPLLPLREGYDYNPVANNNPDNYAAEFLAPMAFLYDDDNSRWAHAKDDKAVRGHIYPLRYDWGLCIKTTPNHAIGKGLFSGSTRYPAKRYCKKIVMTISFKADHKLCVHKELDPNGEKTLEINVPGAELWYLAADTVYGVLDGALQQTSVDGMVIRNDADQLKPILLGALAEYQSTLVRGEIVLQGWQPWRYFLGRTCVPYLEGSDLADWRAPFTSINWNEDGTTTLGIGYA